MKNNKIMSVRESSVIQIPVPFALAFFLLSSVFNFGCNSTSQTQSSNSSGGSTLNSIISLPGSIFTSSSKSASNISAGASVPFVELAAHNANTTGVVIGPSYQLGDLAFDAVDRQAVQLTRGQYVEFTLPQQANAMNLRYSIPDSPSGGGMSASLSIYINGVKQPNNLQLTSKYSWVYGSPNFGDCNGTVWSKSPGGIAHHQFDEIHLLLPQMASGSKVKLQVDSENTASSYAIDVADFEQVAPPLSQPANSISVTSAPYNADPTGGEDATQAIQNAVNDGKAQNKVVWLPQGTYLVTSHIIVDQVTLTGAGPWYSVLTGAPSGGGNGNNTGNGTGVGVYGNNVYDGKTSSNVILSNFAIRGQINNRVDCLSDNGIGGTLNNSQISNIWIEHTKVGMWFDGPMNGLTITGCRINSLTADGINFHRGVSNSIVQHTHIRGSGDDGLAMWSDLNGAPTGDTKNTFDHNTVQSPYVANGIAIYGGAGNTVTNNLVMSAQYRGGGINLDYQDFGAPTAPFSDTTTVSNNLIAYTSGIGDQGILQFPGLMFWANVGAINAPFTVSNNEIDNTLYAAISFDGGNSVSNVSMSNITIKNAEFAFSNKVNNVTGSASQVTATGLSVGPTESCESAGSWNVTMGSGNSGWSADFSSQVCGFPSVTPVPPSSGVTIPAPVFSPAPVPVPIPAPTSVPAPAPAPTPVPAPVLTPAPIPTPVPTVNPAPNGTLVKAINSGGGSSGNFAGDEEFNAGNSYSDNSAPINTSRVAESIPQSVWQSCRWNSAFSYTLTGLNPGATYTVALDWAELTWKAVGQRKFNVAINGTQVLSAFDVFANAGYKTALQKQFVATANNNGEIVIAFTQGGSDNPFITAIEVWKPSQGSNPTWLAPVPSGTLVMATNAGGASSGNFVADESFNTGNSYSDTFTTVDTSRVAEPIPQSVWQSCRWNSAFNYTLTGLTPGAIYTVALDWAELTWKAVGQRKFNVAINGTQVLSAFDVFANAGYKTALQKQFTATANSNGQIVIGFTQAGADNPFITAIEVWKP